MVKSYHHNEGQFLDAFNSTDSFVTQTVGAVGGQKEVYLENSCVHSTARYSGHGGKQGERWGLLRGRPWHPQDLRSVLCSGSNWWWQLMDTWADPNVFSISSFCLFMFLTCYWEALFSTYSAISTILFSTVYQYIDHLIISKPVRWYCNFHHTLHYQENE